MRILLLMLYWGLWYLNFCSRTILSPLLPLIEDALTINHAMAGSLFLAFYIGNTTALFCSGPVSMRIGYKRTIFISFMIMMVSYAALRFVATFHVFMAVIVVLGLSAGFYLPCAIPLITASFERKYWGRAISFHETATGFSFLSAPFLVVLVLHFFQWHSIFLIFSTACLVMGLLLLFFSPDPRPVREQKARLALVLQRKEFWIITILWISCSISSIGIYNLLPLYLVKERGMTVDAANTIFGFSRAGGFIAMIAVGFILDRFNVRKLLFTLMLVTGLFTIGIAAINLRWLLVIMLVAQATFSIVFYPVGLMAVAKLTSLSERSIFTGAMMGISSIIALGLSPVILGAVADRWTFQIGFLFVGLFNIAACALVNKLRDI